MPLWLISLVARAGVPGRFQRLAAIGAAVVAFLALCGLVAGAWALFFHHHDKQVIANHDAVNAAKVATTELNAEQTADANDATRQQDRQDKTADLNAARDEAIRSKPDEAAKPSGPAVSATLDRLRRQAAGNKHPAAH